MILGTRAIGRATMLCCVAASAWANDDGSAASTADALDLRLKRLESELRCLVCQNQTLADSNAIAGRRSAPRSPRARAAGKSDDEIRAYLVARYGDFVLYEPPLKPTTWLLWLGPFALLVGGTCCGGGSSGGARNPAQTLAKRRRKPSAAHARCLKTPATIRPTESRKTWRSPDA